jgi:trigger factor
MKIQRTNQSDTKILFTITGTQNELLAAKQIAIAKLSPQVKLQGFRPGHAPAELVEKQLNPNLLQEETLNEVLNTLYETAVRQEDIRPVAQPKVELKKFVPYTEVEFTAEVDVIGKITLGNYKNLKAKKNTATVAKTDVDEVINRLQTQMAEYKEVDQAAKVGDRAWIDFEGVDAKGETVQGAKGDDYPLALGSNTFIPGFEDNVVGLKKGDKKEFTIPFPKDYGVKALQGKKVTFAITVKKVEETIRPDVNVDFAKKVGPFDSVEALKADIKKQIVAEREHQADRDYQDALVKELIQVSKLSLPDAMLQEQIDIVDKEFRQNLVYRGQTFQEYLSAAGLTEDDYKKKELAPAAEERLKAGLILSELADVEKVTITPEELEIRIQVLKGQYQSDTKMQEELDKPENRREVAARLLTEKTIAKLVSLQANK